MSTRPKTQYKECEPGCTCAKHGSEVRVTRREKLRGEKHKMSPGLWRQDVARRRRTERHMFPPQVGSDC
jgi:hypothetical protein